MKDADSTSKAAGLAQGTATSGVWQLAVAGALLQWCSFDPVGWYPLAWVALLPWLLLIRKDSLAGRKAWLQVWAGGAIFWAAATYYIAIPLLMTAIAWVALFAYLSIYPVLFVFFARILVHDHRVPMIVAAPVVFTALEWVRARGLTGFGFSMLSNSQYRYPVVLQVCDIAGAYGLTFLMVMACAAAVSALTSATVRGRAGSSLAGIIAVLFVFGYGNWSLGQYDQRIEDARQSGRVVPLVVMQGNIDTRFPASEMEQREYLDQQFAEYFELQTNWYKQKGNSSPPRLIIWPEGKYPVPDLLEESDHPDKAVFQREFARFYNMLYQGIAARPVMIVGSGTIGRGGDQWNSALLLDPQGEVEHRYRKIHLVPFGEFIPLQRLFPVLNNTPIGKGILAGERPECFEVDGVRFAPLICFESVVSHFVRESLSRLAAEETEPDILVNVTDDGWFFGAAVLDHHLACNVIRAVENRKSMVVAANTGLSALVDPAGRIVQEGPRRKSAVLEMNVSLLDRSSSTYRYLGDWPAIAMTISCLLGMLTRRQGRGWQKRNRQVTTASSRIQARSASE